MCIWENDKICANGTISFSVKPLKLIIGLGVVSVGVTLLIMLYAILSYLLPTTIA